MNKATFKAIFQTIPQANFSLKNYYKTMNISLEKTLKKGSN